MSGNVFRAAPTTYIILTRIYTWYKYEYNLLQLLQMRLGRLLCTHANQIVSG